jgi:hypothetical protein
MRRLVCLVLSRISFPSQTNLNHQYLLLSWLYTAMGSYSLFSSVNQAMNPASIQVHRPCNTAAPRAGPFGQKTRQEDASSTQIAYQ